MHQYPLPVIDDIFTTLNGGVLFTQIDLAEAYLQIEDDDESKKLLTINTHKGLYRFNRLPFGVKSAPGIFQQLIETVLAGLEDTVAYIDDIIVTGRTASEHFKNLEAVLHRLNDFGLHIRPDKCNFMQEQLKYLGYIVSKESRRPDPARINAILRMPTPKNVADLRSFSE